MESKICPYCKMTIPKRATKCPYCQERIGFANEMVKFGNALIWLGIFIFIFLLIFCLLGCISIEETSNISYDPRRLTDPNWIAARITTEKDDYKKLITISGPWVGYIYKIKLRAYKQYDKDNYFSYDLYIITYPGSWTYEYAYDSDGKKLWMTSQFDIVAGDIRQHIFIDVNRKYLENHSSSGIRLKLYPEGWREEIHFIPPAYIQAFLSVTEDMQN